MKNRSHDQYNQKKRIFWRAFAFAALGIVFVSLVAIQQKSGDSAHAAPFSPACEPHGYLFQYPNTPPTHVQSVDMVTNALSSAGTIASRTVNGVGYNVLDDFMYGWDNSATPERTLVRIHGDLTNADQLTVSGLPGGLPEVFSGDVDPNGQYWFVSGGAGTGEWHYIDLTGGTPTYIDGGAVYGAGPPATLPGSASIVPDLAYVPPTFLNDNREGLYTIVNDGGAPQLYRMDISTPSSPTWELIGSLGAFMTEAEGETGALYADALGALYASSNTGPLWRIIIGNSGLGISLEAFNVGNGPAVSNTDGARCANAYVPMDFGDAPSSYLTDWEDIGPLHMIGNFNEATSTSGLMLGDKIDMENDGFGGAGEAPGAQQDDDNHQPLPFVDDEDGVQHIVAPPSPVDLKVPVVVTNNSSNPATLAGWIDTDGDGDFFDETRVTQDISANAGRGTYELTFPGLDLSSNTYARFRVFEGTGLSNDQLQPAGFDSSFAIGEVEDYLVQAGSFSAKKTANPPAGSDVSPGETLTYTLTITNTGTTDLVDLTVHDDLSDVLDDATLEGDPVVDPSAAGAATVTGDTLEFKGDVSTGQTVTVTYTVKVKPADQLANNSIQNFVIAAQTNCHPGVNSDGSITISHADCNTHHQVAGLANTGRNMVLPIVLAIILIGAAGAAFYFGRKHFAHHGKMPPAKQK